MKSFPVKILVLSSLVFSGIMLSMLLITFISGYYGVEIESEQDLLALADTNQYSSLFKLFIGINHILTFIIFPLIFIFIYYRKDVLKYLKFRIFNPLLIILFPLALISLYPLMAYLTQIVEKIKLPELLAGIDENAMESLSRLLAMHNISDLLINLLLIGILPGIGEELLFRGIIQKELTIFWRNHHVAIWVTAIIFSAFHFQIVGFPAKMLIGLVLGYSYFYSANLLMPIFLHTLNNSLATLSFYFNGSEKEIPSSFSNSIPILPVVASTIIFYWILKYSQSLSKLNLSADE